MSDIIFLVTILVLFTVVWLSGSWWQKTRNWHYMDYKKRKGEAKSQYVSNKQFFSGRKRRK